MCRAVKVRARVWAFGRQSRSVVQVWPSMPGQCAAYLMRTQKCFSENKLKNRYLCKHVHSIVVHNMQKMEATQWWTASVVEWIKCGTFCSIHTME